MSFVGLDAVTAAARVLLLLLMMMIMMMMLPRQVITALLNFLHVRHM